MDGTSGPYSFHATKGTSAWASNEVGKFLGDVLVPQGYTGTLALNGAQSTLKFGTEAAETVSVSVVKRYNAWYLYFVRPKANQVYYALFENGSSGNYWLSFNGHFRAGGSVYTFNGKGRAAGWW